MTTHIRAKEASSFVDKLITTAKQKNLHARRQLIQTLGSGSEALAKRLIEVIAPKFSDRHGGYTRVLHYRERCGDGAMLSVLEFSVPIEVREKKPKKKKEPKAVPAKDKDKKKEEKEPTKKSEPKSEPKAEPETSKPEPQKEEAPKKGGFLGALRKFLKGDDDRKKKK